jgi:hypothetical protein
VKKRWGTILGERETNSTVVTLASAPTEGVMREHARAQKGKPRRSHDYGTLAHL